MKSLERSYLLLFQQLIIEWIGQNIFHFLYILWKMCVIHKTIDWAFSHFCIRFFLLWSMLSFHDGRHLVGIDRQFLRIKKMFLIHFQIKNKSNFYNGCRLLITIFVHQSLSITTWVFKTQRMLFYVDKFYSFWILVKI